MAHPSFQIDPDIRRAAGPPGWVYTDPSVYAMFLERAFRPSWQFATDSDAVRVPGQVHPLTLLDGSLNEPLLLTRDFDDRLHALSNVCTHRGMLVCEQPSHERALRCRYHGRRFQLDGRFQSMPEFEGVANFPSPSDSLPSVALDQWGRLLFTSLQPAKSFDDWIAPVRARMDWMPLADLRPDASRSREYLVRANWALYVENYLEGFHIPYVHASLAETLDYGSYRTELFEDGSVQIAIARGGEAAFQEPRPPSPGEDQLHRLEAGATPDHRLEAGAAAAYYFWLFPNLMLNFYPWGLSLNVVKPLGVDRTRVVFLTYVLDESKLEAGAGAGLDRVEREDEAIVEAVQKGMSSRLFGRARYSPARETGTHHFHRMLAELLARSRPPSHAAVANPDA